MVIDPMSTDILFNEHESNNKIHQTARRSSLVKPKTFIGNHPGRRNNVHRQDEHMREETLLFGRRCAVRGTVGNGTADEHLIGRLFFGK